MILIDCHTHTQYSMDSEADIIACAERAAELGLSAWAITDHCECDAWYTEDHYTPEQKKYLDYYDYRRDFLASAEAVTALKEKYAGRLNILCGVEMGQPESDPAVAEIITADKRLDFIIGSAHRIRKEMDFYCIDYDKMDMDGIYDLLERYFLEVNEMCRINCFDVLGHLTYSLRYMKQRHGIEADISRFDDIIADTFRILAQNGKGIEINTSGLRQGFGDTFPGLKYVKLFREKGGEILSIGSDAHTVEDIGKNVREAEEIALEAGFTRLCYFRERKPVFINIK
ncbi:MAG TPA: PHP domain-containing protein [Ruminococcus sp.]|nr:PHP domain-containing protein [Ruminococcus sp.]